MMYPLLQTRVSSVISANGEGTQPVTIQKSYCGPIIVHRKPTTWLKKKTCLESDPVLSGAPFLEGSWKDTYDKNIYESDWWVKKSKEQVTLLQSWVAKFERADTTMHKLFPAMELARFEAQVTALGINQSQSLEELKQREIYERTDDFLVMLKLVIAMLESPANSTSSKDKTPSSLSGLPNATSKLHQRLHGIVFQSLKDKRFSEELRREDRKIEDWNTDKVDVEPKAVDFVEVAPEHVAIPEQELPSFQPRPIKKSTSFSDLLSLKASEEQLTAALATPPTTENAPSTVPDSSTNQPDPSQDTLKDEEKTQDTAPSVDLDLKMLRLCLLEGDREKALKIALGANLWGEALILASCIDRTVWKETVFQFVEQQLHSMDNSSRLMFGLLSGDSGQASGTLGYFSFSFSQLA
jgi:hypothetical protein